jgi:hypothetical protein
MILDRGWDCNSSKQRSGSFLVSKSAKLRLTDVRRMFRLIGECRDLGADAEAWRRHGFEEVARLLGARGHPFPARTISFSAAGAPAA